MARSHRHDSQSLLDTIMDGGKYKHETTDEPHSCSVKLLRYLDVVAPDWDLTSSIVTTAQSMNGVELQYICGHQDRTRTYEQLSLLAQLIVDAEDKMATQYQRHHGNPRPHVLRTDTAGIGLNTSDGSITKNFAPTIRYRPASAPELQKYIQDRNKWNPHQVFQSVNWPAHGTSFRARIDKRTHLIKLVHGILPTGKVLHRKDTIRNRCPTCQQIMEDWQHIMRCTAAPQQTWRDGTVKAVTEKCQSLSTRPAMKEVLIDGVSGWLHSDEERFVLDRSKHHHDMRQLICQQNLIGWQQLFLGQFSWK